MGISIGGVNLFQQSLDNEYRITILEKILEKIVNKKPDILSENDIQAIKSEALVFLQNKYPEAGIKKGDK